MASSPRSNSLDLARDRALASVDLARSRVSSAAFSPLMISRSNVPELTRTLIQKGLAFARDWSSTVAHSGSKDARRSLYGALEVKQRIHGMLFFPSTQILCST